MESVTLYVVVSVGLAFFSVLCAYLYTTRKQNKLIPEVKKETKQENIKETKFEAVKKQKDVDEKISGSDAWPSEAKSGNLISI